MEKLMKKCPYCAEDIQDAAIKCKHCHEFLDGSSRSAPIQALKADIVPWYCKTSSIVITLLCVPPFSLPLIWLHPTMKVISKLIWSLLAISLTGLTIFSINKAIQLFKDMSELLTSF
jgi:hypothetical protein